MVCPKCKSEHLKVLEKRDIENEPAIRRRRECTDCGFRFTTYERLEVPSLTIVKKDGHKEAYLREKLASGIYKALEKRPVEESEADRLIDDIEREIRATGENEIPSTCIGEIIMRKLLTIDAVAYLRFASVYKSFDDISAFADELKEIAKHKQEKNKNIK